MRKNYYIEMAKERKSISNIIDGADYDLSIDEFICEISYKCSPNVYGTIFPKKVCYDSKNGMVEVSRTLELGDCLIGKSKYAELKISFISKSGSYSIRNIRRWQNFDYFILCFVNSNDNFKAKYYCVEKEVITNNSSLVLGFMNGTKASNMNNDKVGMAVSIKHEDVNFHFKEHNLLEGTSYKHVLKFIESCNKVIHVHSAPLIEQPVVVDIKTQREKATTVSYIYNGKHIKGKSNKDSMFQLVKEIGPKKLEGIIWRSQLGKKMKPCHEYIGNGYYFNPKFSLRDTLLTIRMINEKTNFNVQLIKEI